MMMLAIWLGVAFFGGLALVIFVPWSAARLAGLKWQEQISDYYVWLAMTAGTKIAIVARPGTLELVRKVYDSDQKADKDSKHGDPRHHKDDFGVLSRLKNKSFAFAINSRNVYVDPLIAEIGGKVNEAIERGDIGPEKNSDVMRDGIPIGKKSELVDITDARHLSSGSCEPEWGHESYEMTQISQEGFNEPVSFGQVMVILLAGIGSMFTMWFLTGQSSPSGGTTLTALLVLFATSQMKSREIGAAAYVLLWILSIPILAFSMGGLLTGILVTLVLFGLPVMWVGSIALLGPSMPKILGMMNCSIFWILAQLSVGRGVIVRRATGEYEHHALLTADKDDDHDYYCILDEGDELPIDGSNGDLVRFAWAPLGVTAEKTDHNMSPISESPPESAATDGGWIVPKNKRQGYQPRLRVPGDDEWLVTLPQLASLCKGSAETDAIEHGRDKALTKYGGAQQIGMIALTLGIVGAMVIGGMMGFLAAGGF